MEFVLWGYLEYLTWSNQIRNGNIASRAILIRPISYNYVSRTHCYRDDMSRPFFQGFLTCQVVMWPTVIIRGDVIFAPLMCPHHDETSPRVGTYPHAQTNLLLLSWFQCILIALSVDYSCINSARIWISRTSAFTTHPPPTPPHTFLSPCAVASFL